MNDLTVLGPTEAAFALSIARRFFSEPQDAADAAQDALLAAHRHRASFRGESQLTTWLHRIVVNTVHGMMRKRARRPAPIALDDESARELPSHEPSPAARLEDADIAARARRGVHALGAKYEDVFRLRFDEDLGEAEVARALGVTVATVKIRTHRARHAAREALAGAA